MSNSKVDEQLKNYGIRKGVTRFNFKADKTFTATLGGRNMSGTYSLDTQSKTLHLQFVGGLLGILGTASSLLGKMGNNNLSLVSSLLGNYQGMRIGLKLSK